MKIFYLSSARFPSEVSHTLSIMRMAQALTDRGHEVMLSGIATNTDASQTVIESYGLRGGFELALQPERTLSQTRLARRLQLPGLNTAKRIRRPLRAFAPDLVYSRLTLAELLGVPRSIPLIYEMHSLGPLRRDRLQRRLFRWLIDRQAITRIIVTTDLLAGELRERFPRLDVRVARLSAEVPEQPDENDRLQFQQSMLQGQGFTYHIGYTGYLDRSGMRGTGLIIELARRLPATAFHVVGGEADIVAHWQNEADRLNPNGNLFFYGHRNPRQIPLFLSCFDLVLAPLTPGIGLSQSQSVPMSPLKLAQYMAYGKAIVASDITAHRELLIDGRNAALAPPGDAQAWSNRIEELCGDEARRRQLGDRARQDYFAELTPDRRLDRILEGLERHNATGADRV